ncbi:Hypothetical protein FKW44_003414, partial [Caligus rogercresseyi]
MEEVLKRGTGYWLYSRNFQTRSIPVNRRGDTALLLSSLALGRPDAQLAARSTADSLLRLWTPSYLPLMARKKIIKKLHRFHDLHFVGGGFTATEAKKRQGDKT